MWRFYFTHVLLEVTCYGEPVPRKGSQMAAGSKKAREFHPVGTRMVGQARRAESFGEATIPILPNSPGLPRNRLWNLMGSPTKEGPLLETGVVDQNQGKGLEMGCPASPITGELTSQMPKTKPRLQRWGQARGTESKAPGSQDQLLAFEPGNT